MALGFVESATHPFPLVSLSLAAGSSMVGESGGCSGSWPWREREGRQEEGAVS